MLLVAEDWHAKSVFTKDDKSPPKRVLTYSLSCDMSLSGLLVPEGECVHGIYDLYASCILPNFCSIMQVKYLYQATEVFLKKWDKI